MRKDRFPVDDVQKALVIPGEITVEQMEMIIYYLSKNKRKHRVTDHDPMFGNYKSKKQY